MSREHWPVRKLRLKDEGADDELPRFTPAENWGMMWQLAINAWAFRGVKIESRLPRHVVRVKRRGPKQREDLSDGSSGSD